MTSICGEILGLAFVIILVSYLQNDEFSIGGSSVVLEPGEGGNIFFKHSFDSAGTFSIQVEDLTDQISVTEPEPETPRGIPGFPIQSIVLGIMLVSVLMWLMRKKN